jgi:hypothetical protein
MDLLWISITHEVGLGLLVDGIKLLQDLLPLEAPESSWSMVALIYPQQLL